MSKLLTLIYKIPKFNREATTFAWGIIFGAILSTFYWLYIASLWLTT